MTLKTCHTLLLGLTFVSLSASAEVVEVRDSGFLARSVVVVNATPDKVWSALIRVGRWWNPEHTYSGDAGHMTIDPRRAG